MNRRHSTASTSSRDKEKMTSYIMGIDIGTTSVKVCLINSITREVIHKNVKDTMASVPSEMGASGDKQDVAKIYGALHSCISKMPKDQLRRVVQVAVCGQMHGVVCWRQGRAWARNTRDQLVVDTCPAHVSSLYTWQDGRCDTRFLASLPHPRSHLGLSTGYGCATIFWLLRNKPDFLEQFDRCGTVMDFVVAMMLDLPQPVTSVQNAAGFGFFDCISMQWNSEILEEAKFPVAMLPKVVKSSESAGRLTRDWFDIPAGTPVSAAMGDLQCSVMSTLEDLDHNAVVNVSTSAQMAFVQPDGFQPEHCGRGEARTSIEFFPYFEGRYIAVAASLTGGNALAAFVRMVQQWCMELGCSVPQERIWSTALAAGMKEAEPPSLVTTPTLFGERHQPDQKGSVENINQGNISLGQVTRSVCRGVVGNLAGMMTPDMLRARGVTKIVGSGACLIRNPVLQREIQDMYQTPVHFVEEGNACIGAAMAVADRHFPAPAVPRDLRRPRTLSVSDE